MLGIKITKHSTCRYTAPDGSIHHFRGEDCWENAAALKAKYDAYYAE